MSHTGFVMQINSLLSEYEQHTGQKFGGSDAEYTVLQKLVSVVNTLGPVCCVASQGQITANMLLFSGN